MCPVLSRNFNILQHPSWTPATFDMAKGEGQLTTKVEFGSPYQLDKNQVRPAQSLQIPPGVPIDSVCRYTVQHLPYQSMLNAFRRHKKKISPIYLLPMRMKKPPKMSKSRSGSS